MVGERADAIKRKGVHMVEVINKLPETGETTDF